jgi:DNA polymerase sigma
MVERNHVLSTHLLLIRHMAIYCILFLKSQILISLVSTLISYSSSCTVYKYLFLPKNLCITFLPLLICSNFINKINILFDQVPLYPRTVPYKSFLFLEESSI